MRKFSEAISGRKIRRENDCGFTIVELMVALLVAAILATMAVAGLTSYIRMARFRHNEANAKTVFQMAEIALTRKGTSGEMDAFLQEVTQNGINGDNDTTPHFTKHADEPERDTEEKVARRNAEIYALFYDRDDPTTASSKMVAELLGPYLYDASLLSASLCLEVDGLTGQVYAVFYDTNAHRLRFGQDTNIADRSYRHREGESLVGYYSALDQVNVVTLNPSKLRVQSAQLINGETLSLVWRGNSKMQDLDTTYTVTLYDADGGNTRLYRLEITWADLADTMQRNNGIATLKLKKYKAGGLESGDGSYCSFPLSYSKGSFTLTLDAMVDATILRAYENAPAVGNTQMFSIDRLLKTPTRLKAGVSVKPLEKLKDNYLADGKEKETNIENSHFAERKKATSTGPATYTMTYYRHLYNTRWMPDTTNATFALQKKDGIDHFDWYSGNVVLYTAPATAADRPRAVNPGITQGRAAAWPTIPVWGEQMTLTNSTAATARVTLANLQLRSSSVAAKANPDTAAGRFDKYVGLIGENHGHIENLTLQDANALVNAETGAYPSGAALATGELLYTAADGTATVLRPATAVLEQRPHLEAVGIVCGLNTGTLKNISLTKSKTGTAQLLAAVPFTDTQKTVAATALPHGVGGIVGVAIPRATGSAPLKLSNLTTPAGMTVAGLLREQTDTGAPVNGAAADETEAEEKARYNNAALEPTADGDALWRAIGVGGLAGVYDATAEPTNPANLTNAATVTGSGFTGGVVGNLYSTAAPTLDGLANTGTVAAGNSYQTGSALGQFFGGLAGYAKHVTLQNCTGSMAADLDSAAVTAKLTSGFGAGGTLRAASPLKGDFVGGLVGFGHTITMRNYGTDKGYVMGHTFVGGFVGGSSGSTLFGTGAVTNASNVFGHRYVGGAVAINGAGSTITQVKNTGLLSAMGTNSAYVGGIAAVNDATWGDQTAPGPAVISSCTNLSSIDQYTDAGNANFLQEISTVDGEGVYTACFVGGITGYNGKGGTLALDTAAPQVKAVLYGGHYIGGVAGYNAPDAGAITGNGITVNGTILGRGDCAGGFIGMNRKAHVGIAGLGVSTDAFLPDDLNIAVNAIRGCYFVGGVIGANLPQGSFAVPATPPPANTASWRTGTGRLNANGAAGGIIGYNRVLPSGVSLTGGTEAEKLRKLLPTVGSDGVLTEPALAAATGTARLDGVENKLNINANLYVGGIVGYNAAATTLTIKNAVNGAAGNIGVGGIGKNALPLTLAAGTPTAVSFNAALYALGSQYTVSALDANPAPDVATGFAGGIIGINSALSTLDGCVNYGSILGHNTVVGGMAALNLGTMQACTQSANLGNKQAGSLYLGGMAGINLAAAPGGTTTGGEIKNSTVASGYTIQGEKYVGGIAGLNRTPRGGSTSPGANITVPNRLTGYTVAAVAYAGGVAGLNYGTIGPGSTAGRGNLEVSATADSRYAGGAVGYNGEAGLVYSLTHNAGANSVRTTSFAGGIAGGNAGTLTGCGNASGAIEAEARYAGGITGHNTGRIENCDHRACGERAVYAATGYAGGLAGYNGGNGTFTPDDPALITGCTVSGSVTAATGEAGGITAHNRGTIRGGANPVSAAHAGALIQGTARAIGAVAAYNEGTICGTDTGNRLTLTTNAQAACRPHLAGPATQVGALVGNNTGKVQHCAVETDSVDFGGLTASEITLGGAVGVNESAAGVEDVQATLAITESTARFIDIGGVVGGNHGTVHGCAYAGTLGHAGEAAARLGSTLGGLAGFNDGTVQDSTVDSIQLDAQGTFSVDASQSPGEKLANASHVGGAVGRNDGTVINVTVATSGTANRVKAQYGFVGGVAGSNSGTIRSCGGNGTQPLVGKVAAWTNHDGKTTAEKNSLIQQMAAALKTKTTVAEAGGVFTFSTANPADSAYKDLLGHDTINSPGAANELLVTLAGGSTKNARGNGYLGGLTGFNAASGQIAASATGQWFVYGNNIAPAAAMGGAIGRNEAERELKHLVNCAAVRRFCRTEDGDTGKDDNWNADNQGSANGTIIVDHVGGLIGVQQNRTASGWEITDCVNVGSVFNSRSNNVGGIVSYLSSNGGNFTRCYNFGYLACNTNAGDASGTVGGIAGYFDNPTSGDTINLVSCRNYGSIYGVCASRRANDCAGIFGKTMLTNPTDPLTINLFDCVNEAPTIQADRLSVGVFAWLGPLSELKIDNVVLNIDRCRSFTCQLDSNAEPNQAVGICGCRGWGDKYPAQWDTVGKTTVTNCFALYDVDPNAAQHPIYYTTAGRWGLPNVVTNNNYYMDRRSFDPAYIAGLLTLERSFEPSKPQVTGTKQIDWQNHYGRILFAGKDNGADSGTDGDNSAPYFGVDIQYLHDTNTEGFRVGTHRIAAPGHAFADPTKERYLEFDDWCKTNAGSLPLLFQEENEAENEVPNFEDVTDEAIRNYYEYLLDSELPNPAADVTVTRSGVGTNVYGRYRVTWQPPRTGEVPDANVTDYRVEILIRQADGSFLAEAPVYLLNCEAVIEGKPEWCGREFQVRVTPRNTKGECATPAVSEPTLFVKNMPKPDLEVRLVKAATGYEQWLVLKNTADYPAAEEGWTVSVDILDDKNTKTTKVLAPSATADKTALGEYYCKLADTTAGPRNYRAFAEPTATGTLQEEWMRSALFREDLYVPSIAAANGLAEGTLHLTPADITVTGTTVNDLSLAATLKFDPKNAGLAPRYTVALVGKAKAGCPAVEIDGVTGLDISNRYVVLASRSNAVQPAGTTFTLSNLPSDTLTDFEDWQVIAYPTNSGEGPVTTVYKATGAEAAAALAANPPPGDIRTTATLELTRAAGTAPGTFLYTARHATPLGYLGTSATAQVRAVALRTLVDVLAAPTLQDFPASPAPYSINADNELTYTFTWTQALRPGEPAPTADKYGVALYGVAADGAVTEIPFAAGYDPAAHITVAAGTAPYQYILNIEKDLQNGSESWRFDKVRLQLTRKADRAASPKKEIGATGARTYEVKTRLAKVAAPGAVGPAAEALSDATALHYTVSWPAITDTTNLAGYTLYAEKYDSGTNAWTPAFNADGTPLGWNTPDANPALTVNLEANQGDTLRFYAVARSSNPATVLDGPNGVPDAGSTIMTRQAAPTLGSLHFSKDTPNMEEFLNNLTIRFAPVAGEADSTYYFTGYLFDNLADYTDAVAAVHTWEAESNPAQKAAAYKALCDLLAGKVGRTATLMVAPTGVNVGQAAQGNGTEVSYRLAPDPNGFTMRPEYAGQYLLAALHTMPPSSSEKAPSAWSFYTAGPALTLPAITLDAPCVTPTAAEYTATARLSLNAEETPTDYELTASHTAIRWEPVDSYNKADGATTNLTAQYEVRITPNPAGNYPPGYNQNPYTIRMTAAPRDIRGTATPPDLQYKRGALIKVEKTYDGTTYFEIPPVALPDGTSCYDLSRQSAAIPDTQPVEVKGSVRVEVGGVDTVFHYTQLCVPRLTVTPEGDTVSYRVVLPDLSAPVTATDALQKFTSAVSVTACNDAHVAESDHKAGYQVENSAPADWVNPAAAPLLAAAPLMLPATPETAAPEQPPAA